VLSSCGRSIAYILQEADLNARRTHRLNIAEEIARKLQMNYVFGREFQELVQGSKESPAYHGQATLAKWPILKPRLPLLATVELLAAPLVPAADGAFSGEAWRPNRIITIAEINVAGSRLITYKLHLVV
jgi:hypothetical protein